MNTKLKFVKNNIYKMKRSYGLPISYYQLVEHEMTPDTGVKNTTLRKINISRAIVLRAREFRSFVYDLAFISANKDFTTGGFFDPEDRRIIIDASDAPINFEPNVDDFIIFQNEKHEVKEVHHFENNYAYLLLTRKLRGAIITQIMDLLTVMNLQHSVTYEIQDKLVRELKSVLNLTQEVNEVA